MDPLRYGLLFMSEKVSFPNWSFIEEMNLQVGSVLCTGDHRNSILEPMLPGYPHEPE